VTWALALALEDTGRRSRILAALCGTLPYVRPELGLLGVLLLFVSALRHRRLAAGNPAALKRAIAGDLIAAALGAAPWALWCLLSLGGPIPTTVAAKRYYFAQAGFPAPLKTAVVRRALRGFSDDLGVLALAVPGLLLTPAGRAGLAFVALFLTAYWAQFPGALNTYEGRYFYPLLPIVVLGAASIFRYAWQSRGRAAALGNGAAAVVLVATLGQTAGARPERANIYRGYYEAAATHLVGVTNWCRDNLPPGRHGHDPRRRLYRLRLEPAPRGLVGLKTPSSIPYHRG
jgi:hypothetical protein